jgi:hypothetical protein
MRTKTLLLSAAVGAASLVAASAQTVYSVNSVGYVNVTLPAGFSLIANPLDAGDNALSNVFGDSLAIGSTVFKWDNGTSQYTSSTYLGVWSPDLELAPGEGAFINVGAETQVTFVGEVLQGDLTNPIPAGFSLQASQVPQEDTLDNLNFPAAVGDTVYFWDNGTSQYTSTTYLGVWSPSDPTPKVAEGFFVSTGAAKDWTRTFSVNN